jgi:hypothetical protein
VRVFEWNGTRLHAKTAVADGRWARVGLMNLNIASWLGVALLYRSYTLRREGKRERGGHRGQAMSRRATVEKVTHRSSRSTMFKNFARQID